MDLALEMGMPVEHLARIMTEREFRRWHLYATKKLLPAARVELYLAQIAQMIGITMGGAKDAKITDYLIVLEPVKEVTVETPEDIVAEARKAFGYNPRKKKG